MGRRARRDPGAAWEAALFELLTYLGWTWKHTRPAYVPGRVAPITPVHGPGAAGDPDITAYRLEGHRGAARYLVAEAKAGDAVLTPAQRARLEELDHVGLEAYRFRERDYDLIRGLLTRPTRPWPVELNDPDDLGVLCPWRARPSARFRVATSGRA